jgi:hypothetical protein
MLAEDDQRFGRIVGDYLRALAVTRGSCCTAGT